MAVEQLLENEPLENEEELVYHPGDLKPQTLGLNDELDGEDVLPGFRLKVSELFV